MQVTIKASVRKKLKTYALNMDITMSELTERLLEEGLQRIEIQQQKTNYKQEREVHKN